MRPHGRVTLYSAAEARYCAGLLEGYRARHPEVEVEFVFGISTALHERYLSEAAAGTPRADLFWSSAMDLQMALVEAGHALSWRSAEAAALPAGAVYRDLAYATTVEPLFTLVRRDCFAAETSAGSLPEIVAALGAGVRVAAYDIARNGLGFLALLQESRRGAPFDDFLRALAASRPVAYGSTPPLVEAVASGRAALAYHVLGSYAERAVQAHPGLAIARTNEPWVAVSRIAFIPKSALNPDAAKSFLDYLLSGDGQQRLARGGFAPIRGQDAGMSVAPIRLDDSFAWLLDNGRREALLARWREVGAECL